MKKNYKLIIFICMVIVQLAVPAYMIAGREVTLNNGQQFKFRAAPVDPYDAFRGRYLSIRLKEQSIPVQNGSEFYRNQTVYVTIENDSDGYARLTGVSPYKPQRGAFFKTKVEFVEMDYETNPDQTHVKSTGKAKAVNIRIPFDRYYMPEKKAPIAEKEYNEKVREPESDVYVTVRILSGRAVLEGLYISGKPIEEYLKDKSAK